MASAFGSICLINILISNVFAQTTLPAISVRPFTFSIYTGTTFPSFLSVGKASGTSISTADFTTDAANGGGGAQWRAETANGIRYLGDPPFKVMNNGGGRKKKAQ
ncbi:MAG: hypothetical protein ABI763_12210 [Bacteroidota bacterium]